MNPSPWCIASTRLRVAARLLLAVGCLLGASPARAEAGPSLPPLEQAPVLAVPLSAASFSVLRQEYGYWTHFLLHGPDGVALGVVERRHWRQPWRRGYELYDAAGTRLARATQPWISVGNVWTWGARFVLRDHEGKLLARLAGRTLTLQPAAYTLTDPNGRVVAEAAVDDCGQGVVFRAPNSRRQVASFLREQQASAGNDRWLVRVDDEGALAPEAWALVAAFFADAWRSLGRGCPDG